MPPSTSSAKKVSKSTLSMFLRTRCDKELYLSLHDTSTMAAAGLPAPVKRPGIGTLSIAGRELELERNDQLVRLFDTIVQYNRGANNFNDTNLENELQTITAAPAIILQPKYSVSNIKNETLTNIGLLAADIAVVPVIADFIPDLLLVREPREGDLEITPNGARVPIEPLVENRLAIDIFDIKHTSESNPSYCAEIAMYAIMMSNWLAKKPALSSRFFISTSAYLWTRYKQGDSALDKLEAMGSASLGQLIDALVDDSEDACLRFYLASVRRFFEDIVRVIRIAEIPTVAWENLEWHVSGTCGNCDWLGDKRHLGGSQKVTVDANQMHYCMPAATITGHLSLIPGITRGAKKTLLKNLILDAAALSVAHGNLAFQQHTILKRDAGNLPSRSSAILNQTLSSDPSAVIASLAGSANLQLFASINFDSSAGLLTGMAISGFATTYTSGVAPTRFNSVAYIVDEKNLQAEWVALEGFLSQIGDSIARAEQLVNGSLKGQIHFWEKRQFTELCNAIGRHLPRVLALSDRKTKALAWIFPPDDFIARPESLEASTVVTIDDIIRRMVFTPTPHVITLFETAEAYPAGPVQTVRDSYYREYLSNGIPRERIYEIWGNVPQIKRGTTLLPRNTAIAQYAVALEKQSKALESVCERLRRDYRGHFKAKAPHIPSSVPQGARNVAFDAKLWIWWDSLNFNASQLESHMLLAIEGERLEATYEAILLNNGVQIMPGRYRFDVAPSSTEAKFKEDSMLTLGKLGRPGLPLEHGSNLLNSNPPMYNGNQDLFYAPLWSVLKAKLISFDRVNLTAEVDLNHYQDANFVPYLITNSSVDLLNDVFLLASKIPKAFDWSITSSKILREIGNPPIAVVDQNAAAAMGITPPTRQRRTSTNTPAAILLWDAATLEQTARIATTDATTIANYVEITDGLNPSQKSAVLNATEKALTLIWGPPGTGKTNTLAGLIHGLVQKTVTDNAPLKILVTGPTYKAVEEIMSRTAKFIGADTSAPCMMYMGYSKQRTLSSLGFVPSPHLQYTPFSLDNTDPDCQQCLLKLSDNTSVIIVGVQIQQARRFPEWLHDSFLHPTFDVVIIDESSQVPVSKSLSAICGLKSDSRLVIAGDHLQMPPITQIEAPAEAAYLVGSIQTYLQERTFSQPITPSVLNRNYRSAEDIVTFAKSIGYPSALTAEHPDTALYFMGALPEQVDYPVHLPWCPEFGQLLSPQHPVAAILHEDEISSQGNQFEAELVAGMVWMLRQTVSSELDGRDVTSHSLTTAEDFWKKCIGIVTPHRAQRALVIRELENLFPGENNMIDDAVDTVERFQGGERHCIIVTFGVADTDVIAGEEVFLMQLERTNVAVSRAMGKCIVVMPKTLAQHIPEDKNALETAFAIKDYLEDFCNVRVDTQLTQTHQSRAAQVRFHQ